LTGLERQRGAGGRRKGDTAGHLRNSELAFAGRKQRIKAMKILTCRGAAILPAALLAVSVQVAATEQIPAVLKMREVDFFYRSSVAVFSCPDLENRVASIFRGLGAREDVDVQVNGCDSVVFPGDGAEQQQDTWEQRQGGSNSSFDWNASANPAGDRYGNRFANSRRGPQQSSHVRVRLMMPVPVTPEILAEMEKDKSRRELVSRVTGNPSAGMNDPIVFPAERRVVTLSRKTADLDPEECELLEQMGTSVFRELDMRIVRGRPNCDRTRISHIPLKVEVETLMPFMPTGPQLLPAEGSASEPEQPAPAAPAETPAESPKPN
jgi:hypothetical protein